MDMIISINDIMRSFNNYHFKTYTARKLLFISPYLCHEHIVPILYALNKYKNAVSNYNQNIKKIEQGTTKTTAKFNSLSTHHQHQQYISKDVIVPCLLSALPNDIWSCISPNLHVIDWYHLSQTSRDLKSKLLNDQFLKQVDFNDGLSNDNPHVNMESDLFDVSNRRKNIFKKIYRFSLCSNIHAVLYIGRKTKVLYLEHSISNGLAIRYHFDIVNGLVVRFCIVWSVKVDYVTSNSEWYNIHSISINLRISDDNRKPISWTLFNYRYTNVFHNYTYTNALRNYPLLYICNLCCSFAMPGRSVATATLN